MPWEILYVATGQIASSTMAPTRNKADFACHIQQLLDADSEAEWIFFASSPFTVKARHAHTPQTVAGTAKSLLPSYIEV